MNRQSNLDYMDLRFRRSEPKASGQGEAPKAPFTRPIFVGGGK
jgi:hypothetical protein